MGEGVEREFIDRKLGGLVHIGGCVLDELAKLFGQNRGRGLLLWGVVAHVEVAQFTPEVLQIIEIAAQSGLGDHDCEEIVTGAQETIAGLERSGITVYVVSGGLLQPVTAFAQSLGIAAARVHAVEVYFDASGAYRGFDTSSPLSRSDGKAIVCRAIAAEHGSVAMVGDGVTDLAARAGGAYVVGYGGVVRRPAVEHGANTYVATPSLTGVLDALLIGDEQERS